MPGTEPLTGARIPNQSDGPLGGLQVGNAVTDLSKYTVPRFPTTGVRDTSYSNFVTAGGVLEDGMHCTVGKDRYRRYNGDWLLDTNNGGTSGVLAGTAPPAGTPVVIKTVYASIVFNAQGDGTVFYPIGTFANGITAVTAIHVSPGGPPSNELGFVPWNITLSSTAIRCYSPGGAIFGGTGVACSLTLIGW